MQKEVLLYSSHPKITPWDLKNLSWFDGSISIQDLQKTQQIFQQNNIKAFTEWSTDYHHKFHSISAKPYIIHYMWDISLLDKDIVAIVWPRKATNYSNKVLRKFFEHAQNYNLVTISGMAEGVDQISHALSIKHNIPTIAVLWWWLNHYLQGPKRHIIESIVQNGWLVISEYKLDFKPTKYSFPQRNRIVAWLCDVLFLPEASEKSWSLITADFAYQLSRPVYVTPNDIFVSTSVWVNQLLIHNKAKILIDFPWFFDDNFAKHTVLSKTKPQNTTPEQNKILDCLSQDWEASLQNLSQLTHMDINTLMQDITMLEINNYVYQSTPWTYKIC